MQCRHSEPVTCRLTDLPSEDTCANCIRAEFPYSTTPVKALSTKGICTRGKHRCRLADVPSGATCDNCEKAGWPYAIGKPVKKTKKPDPK